MHSARVWVLYQDWKVEQDSDKFVGSVEVNGMDEDQVEAAYGRPREEQSKGGLLKRRLVTVVDKGKL